MTVIQTQAAAFPDLDTPLTEGQVTADITAVLLQQAIDAAEGILIDFAAHAEAENVLDIAFGSGEEAGMHEPGQRSQPLQTLLQRWQLGEFSMLPMIEIRDASDINGAYGAYSSDTGRIYLAQSLFQSPTDSDAQPFTPSIHRVLLEEIGHFVDDAVNPTDSAGDEGDIFARLVQGQSIDDLTLSQLRQENDTVSVQWNGTSVQLEQATPGANPAFDLIGLTQLRNDSRFAGIDGSNTTVAVIDSGLDQYHSLLRPAYVTGYDFVNNTVSSIDRLQHGTHVSGTVGARDENVGVATDAGLIGLQVFQNGFASNARIEDALEWVLANHERYNIVAVNMSLGSGFFTSESQSRFSLLYDDVKRLEDAGVAVVAAAGNNYKNTESQNVAEPAVFSTFAVGAVWQDGRYTNSRFDAGAIDYTTGADRIASFSQRMTGPNTLFAPGAYIRSTIPGGGLREMAGTSMATPMVSGAIALLQEAAMTFGGRKLAPDELVDILRSTGDRVFDGDDENDNVRNTNTSYPRLNVYKAVNEVYDRFRAIAPPSPGIGMPSSDANGTLEGAILAPSLNGAATRPISGSIGIDGENTPIGNKDVDIYRFSVESPGSVTIALASHPTQREDFDSFLRLFNASGQPIASDDSSGIGNFSQLTASLPTGTYYVGVSGDANRAYNPSVSNSGVAGDTGTYALQFSLNNPDTDGTISGATAVNPGSSRVPYQVQGRIGQDGSTPVSVADVDMFEVYVPDAGRLLLDIDTPFSDGQYVDSLVRVFDENGLQVGFNDNGFAVNDQGQIVEFSTNFNNRVYRNPSNLSTFEGHTTDSFLSASVQGGKTYYVAVSERLNSSYDPRNLNNRPSANQTGLYNLAIAFASNDQNGTIDQAKRLPALALSGSRQVQSIGRDSTVQVGRQDVDIFRVKPGATGILDIDIDSRTGVTLSDSVDTVAYLFNGAGQLLGSNDDRDGADPGLRVQVQANMDYYVAIAGYGNGNFDPFQLGSGSTGDTGDYYLTSRLLSSADAAKLTDNSLTASGIRDIQVGDVVDGTIGDDNGFVTGASDVDLYRFVPKATGSVSIRTLATNAFTADTFLRLFDAQGNELAFNDNENPITRGSAIQFTAQAGATYYVGVSGSSRQPRNYNPVSGLGAVNGSEGDYTLTLTQLSSLAVGISRIGTSNNDVLTGTEGNDFLAGKKGNDQLIGRGGDDTLAGNGGKDRLDGGTGNDQLNGGGRRDTLNGDAGNDILTGGGGKDTLNGGDGDDYLDGKKGRDRLYGGDGADVFVLNSKRGRDRIFDYEDGTDTLALDGFKYRDLDFQQRGNTRRSYKALILLDDRKIALINDVQVNDLTAADFTSL